MQNMKKKLQILLFIKYHPSYKDNALVAQWKSNVRIEVSVRN